MDTAETKYTAYLLRIWQTKHSGTRIILQNVHSGEEHLFSCMADLVLFVDGQPEENDADETGGEGSVIGLIVA